MIGDRLSKRRERPMTDLGVVRQQTMLSLTYNVDARNCQLLFTSPPFFHPPPPHQVSRYNGRPPFSGGFAAPLPIKSDRLQRVRASRDPLSGY